MVRWPSRYKAARAAMPHTQQPLAFGLLIISISISACSGTYPYLQYQHEVRPFLHGVTGSFVSASLPYVIYPPWSKTSSTATYLRYLVLSYPPEWILPALRNIYSYKCPLSGLLLPRSLFFVSFPLLRRHDTSLRPESTRARSIFSSWGQSGPEASCSSCLRGPRFAT